MPTVEELLWRIDATTEGLRTELKRGDQAVAKFERGVDTRLGKVDKAFSGLGRVLARSVLPALIGVASVAGIKKVIDDVDRLGQTADKLGITAERLQELRFAAEQNGVAAQTLDMAYQRFTRRLGEAQQGTGELLPVLEQYGIALRDVNGRMRTSDEVFGDLADAIQGAGTSQEQLRIAFKAFDSEGAALVNLMRQGSDGMQEYAARARELGIVLEEEFVQEAQRAKAELDVLGKVISGNLSRAVLDLAPLVTDAAKAFSEMASDAGYAYEKLKAILKGDFNFESLSKRGHEKRLQEISAELAELHQRKQYVLTDFARENIEAEIHRLYDEYQAVNERLAKFDENGGKPENKPNTPPPGDTGGVQTQEQIAAAKAAAQRLESIEEGLQNKLFNLRFEGTEKVREEYKRLLADISGLAKEGDVDPATLERARELAGELRDEQLSRIKESQAAAVNKSMEAIRRENAELALMVDATKRGSAAVEEATAKLEREAAVREYVRQAKEAGVKLTDEQITAYEKEVEAGQRLRKSIEDIGDTQRTAAELSRSFGNAYVSAMEDVIWNSKSATDAVRGLITEIAKIGVRKAFLEPAGDAFGSFLSDLFPFERGGVMSSQGPVPLRAYASGGVANSPQMALFGEGSRPEAYVPLPDGRSIPVSLQGGMGGVAVNVRVYNNASGTQANADFRRDGNGQFTLDVIVEQVETKMARNVGRGEGMATTLERRYGLNPAAGSYR